MNTPIKQTWGKITDIAKYTGLSERTIRNLLKDGLPYVRLKSGTILINFHELDNYLMTFRKIDNQIDKFVNEIIKEVTD